MKNQNVADEWLHELNSGERVRAEAMLKALRKLEIPQAESIIKQDLAGESAGVAERLLLRDLWKEIDAWRADSEEWIPGCIGACDKDPSGSFADAGLALERMLAAGVDPTDIGRVARLIAYKTVYHCLHLIDEGSEAEAYEDLPGWKLVETDAQSQETGRRLRLLHDKLLEFEPTTVQAKLSH